MENKLFVGGLPYEATQDELTKMFSACGTVKDVKLIMDRETGRSKGFGFVEMSSEAEAQAAIAKLNGAAMGQRQIFINIAKPLEKRDDASGGAVSKYAGVERRSGRDRRASGGFGGPKSSAGSGERRESFGEKKPWAEKKPWGEKKPWADKKPWGEKKPWADKKPWGDKPAGSSEKKPWADKKPWSDKPAASGEKKPWTVRKPWSDKPGASGEKKPWTGKPSFGPKKWGKPGGKPGGFKGKGGGFKRRD